MILESVGYSVFYLGAKLKLELNVYTNLFFFLDNLICL